MKKKIKKEDFNVTIKYHPLVDVPSPPNTVSFKWIYVDFSNGKERVL
jgi:hypothetical protein